ncbi:TSUP family transporter [Nesterenkonia sphaerica]|uniref:Probable membrane transporter protein n=1 Tax=Nesterenkonia sphaerica TaxID=1804988 RepID=A0A5R9AFM6_9MICC|nr:TSUP family transporter [Nesterenkonia sphaerica]TLP76825.1 hypothetical protein FEF27_06100 [Nesterenkonia sphaerica]
MGDEAVLLTAVFGLILVAAVLQRMTGLGFAMMLAPFLVVILGPHTGVMLTNMLAFVAPLLMLGMVWRQIEWRRLVIIAPVALLVMPVFGWIAAVSPPGPLYIVVASLVLLGLTLSLVVSRIHARADGPVTRILTGIGAGGGVVLAGVGGPALTVYAVVSRWNVRAFAATLQPLWIVFSAAGFLTKWTFSGDEIPVFPWWFWAGSLAVIVVGLGVGTLLSRKVRDSAVRRLVIALAFVGALLSLATGIRETLGL